MPTSTVEPILVNDPDAVVREIEAKGWWQGAVLSGTELNSLFKDTPVVELWIIASQTCNLYNPSLLKVPLVELVGAKRIDYCDNAKVKGDNPRILHVEAGSPDGSIALELDILTRCWIPRQLLAELPIPSFRLRDNLDTREDGQLTQRWNDNFAGWMGRSYTRIALPDQFNRSMRDSRIEKIIDTKLVKQHKDLYGIYFAIDYDGEDPWSGALGEMPPPYLLGIMLVVEEQADPEVIRLEFSQQLFEAKIPDPQNKDNKTTRAELARRFNIRILPSDVMAKSVSEVTLHELRGLVRFSMVDHLSDSTMAAAD